MTYFLTELPADANTNEIIEKINEIIAANNDNISKLRYVERCGTCASGVAMPNESMYCHERSEKVDKLQVCNQYDGGE
ncbi:MAG: hypothetical protein KAJ07_04570 [Planctomycetes bacterium]|nr:hypothetical protein [Planctomycetota bacterium]